MVINRIFKWVVPLGIGFGLIIFTFIFRGQQLREPEITVSSQPSPEATAGEATPTLSIVPTSTRMPTPSIKVTNPAATCQLTGSIDFINDNLYETKGAKISYQNVDDHIRQIYWKTNPDDGALVVGPNLFEQLIIPDGERQVGVTLTKNTGAKSYLLTAQVTYGVRDSNGNVQVKIANCYGFVIVNMPK